MGCTRRARCGRSQGWGARYASKRLWDADPRNDGSLPPLPFVPFGGWTQRAVVQYTSSVLVCGLNVDMDWEEDEVTQADKDEVVARY